MFEIGTVERGLPWQSAGERQYRCLSSCWDYVKEALFTVNDLLHCPAEGLPPFDWFNYNSSLCRSTPRNACMIEHATKTVFSCLLKWWIRWCYCVQLSPVITTTLSKKGEMKNVSVFCADGCSVESLPLRRQVYPAPALTVSAQTIGGAKELETGTRHLDGISGAYYK